jgi:outer membrane protein TolC
MNSSVHRRNGRARGIFALAGLLAFALPSPAPAQDAGKLSLRQAVALALQNSRELRLARMQYNVALDEAGVSRAAFRPNLYTGAGAAYTHGFPSLPGGQAPSVFELDYSQTIFNPMLKGEQRAAEERAKSQKIEMDRARDDVIVRTATVYLEFAKVQHSAELMRSEEASAEKILEVVRERVAANQELPIEVTRGELTLARIRERIVKLGDRAEALEAQIRDLTAIPDSQSIEVDTEEPSFAEALSSGPSETEMIDLAVQNDRGVAEAENERAAREHILRGARLSRWPTIDLVGQYSILSKFNNYGDFYKKFERNNVNVGLQVTIPLFAAKTSANVALAKSQLNAAELRLAQKRQEVRLDVQQKSRSVRELDASRKVARLDLQLAQETLQLLQAKFDQGRATLQEIEQARLEESDKWVAFLDADFARQQAQLTLLQATGQLAKVFP